MPQFRPRRCCRTRARSRTSRLRGALLETFSWSFCLMGQKLLASLLNAGVHSASFNLNICWLGRTPCPVTPSSNWGWTWIMVQAPPKRKKSIPGRLSPEGGERKDFFCERDGVRYAGTHLIIDLVRAERLDDLEHIEQTLRRCVEVAGATLLHIHLHHFTPNGGVSGVAVLAESHISIHSWPEYGYAALDVFMCGADQSASVHRRLEGGVLASQGGGQGASARQGNEPMDRKVRPLGRRDAPPWLPCPSDGGPRPLRQRDRASAADHLRKRRFRARDDARQHRAAHDEGRVRLPRDDVARAAVRPRQGAQRR